MKNKALQDNNGAIKDLNLAIKIDPKNSEAFYQLAMVYKKLDKIEKYRESIKWSVRIDKDSFRSHEALGLLYADEKNYDQAILEIRKAIDLKANVPGLYLILGKLLLESDREQEAAETFKEAADLFP